MDIRWLQDFLTVAETGNFTRAAAIRHASQAAFSRRIQQLESWVGAPLIDRSLFPTRLTREGEAFRSTASEVLRQMVDARTAIAGRTPARSDHIRLALPYALATSHLPRWWRQWTQDWPLSSHVETGNVHDLATALMAGNADVMICFQSAQQPIELDEDKVETMPIGADVLRPFGPSASAEHLRHLWPGSARRPVPLLVYSPGVYFARIVDLMIESAGEALISQRVVTSDMADVLRDMAVAGLGIAFLPEETAATAGDRLKPVAGPDWIMPLSIIAFRQKDNTGRATGKLWEIMRQTAKIEALAHP